jgi:MFS family permease
VPLTAEMHLSPTQFGFVAGSFFWLFSTSTIVIGFLSNRVPTRILLLAMSICWAVVQIPQALATSLTVFLLCRVILGAAEGPSFPVSVHALYKWFPNHKRNLPVAIVNQGAALGLLLAGLLIPLITHKWGWRMNFFILSAVGAVWTALWLCFGREGTLGVQQRDPASRNIDARTNVDPQPTRLPYRKILTNCSVLSTFLLGFVAYWMLGQNLAWLPTYLEKGLGFTNIDSGRWFAAVIAVASPVNIGLSWFSQWLLERGATTQQARARLVCITVLAGGAMLATLPLFPLPPIGKAALLAFACALPTLCFTLAPALLAEVVPDSQRGAIVGIHTAVASLGAAIAPTVMGRIVQAHGGTSHAYEIGFATSAVLLIFAATIGLRWLHPVRSHRMLHGEAVPDVAWPIAPARNVAER